MKIKIPGDLKLNHPCPVGDTSGVPNESSDGVGDKEKDRARAAVASTTPGSVVPESLPDSFSASASMKVGAVKLDRAMD